MLDGQSVSSEPVRVDPASVQEEVRTARGGAERVFAEQERTVAQKRIVADEVRPHPE
jgi:hypothetical protein